MSLASQVSLLATRVGQECKAIRTWATSTFAAVGHGHALTDATITGTIPDADLPPRLMPQGISNQVADANLATSQGHYWSTGTNNPSAVGGHLWVANYDTTYVVQLWVASSLNNFWFRRCVAGVWSGWVRTLNTNDSTSFQPIDADLTAIAALVTTTYGRSLLTAADAAAARTLLDAQPLDADLTSIAALTTTAYGRAFLTLADAAAARSTLGVGVPAVPWRYTVTYAAGAVVGYAGRLWRATTAHSNKPPIMFSNQWEAVTGADPTAWSQLDPNFTADNMNLTWEVFWKTGTSTASLTTTAGEFETGKQALKLVMGASSGQTIYDKGPEENLVRGGEVITVCVRAKVISGGGIGGPTLNATLMQNDATATPEPLASGLVNTSSIGGAQSIATSWQTYFFHMVAANAKPRACLNVIFNTGLNAATIVIDRVTIARSGNEDTGWITGALINGWLNYDSGLAYGGTGRIFQYRRLNGRTYLRGVVRSGTNGTIIFNLPVGFRSETTSAYETACIVLCSGGVAQVIHSGASGELLNTAISGSATAYTYLGGYSHTCDQS